MDKCSDDMPKQGASPSGIALMALFFGSMAIGLAQHPDSAFLAPWEALPGARTLTAAAERASQLAAETEVHAPWETEVHSLQRHNGTTITGYTGVTFTYYPNRMTWPNAQRYCAAQHTKLAVVLNIEDSDLLEHVIHRSHTNARGTWLGATSLDVNDALYTVS